MAVQEKRATVNEADIKKAILDAISELLDEHESQVTEIRDRSEGRCITVNFANEIDCSKSEPAVRTKIRFSEAYTDERNVTIKRDEKNQLKFETLEHAGRGGRAKEPATEPANGDGAPTE